MTESTRVSLLTNILPPYRVPLFNEISKNKELELKVFLMAANQKNRDWEVLEDRIEFDYHVLRGLSMYTYSLDVSIKINPTIMYNLYRSDPDVLLVGGFSDITSWAMLAYSEVTQAPLVIWSGSWNRSARGNIVTRAVKRAFISRGDVWISYGSESAKHMISLGADSSRTYKSMNTVDVESFRWRSQEYIEKDEDQRFELLYCGQLIPRKNIELVFDAICKISSEKLQFRIIGDGPLKKELNNKADLIEPEVIFEGRLDREELIKFYTKSDALILPSKREVWGLVVNEALACGTPSLVSDRCGCATDLIRPGFNGDVFNPNRPNEIEDVIREWIEKRHKIDNRREEISKIIVENFGIENSAEAFIRAIEDARDSGKINKIDNDVIGF